MKRKLPAIIVFAICAGLLAFHPNGLGFWWGVGAGISFVEVMS